MRTRVRLNVVNHNALCPVSGKWEPVERCRRCPAISVLDDADDPKVVVCQPELERPAVATRARA